MPFLPEGRASAHGHELEPAHSVHRCEEEGLGGAYDDRHGESQFVPTER